MSKNFNDFSKNSAPKPEKKASKEDPIAREKRTGERTRFIFKPDQMVERAYLIYEYDFKKGDYDHVGDYILINKAEPHDITEKKLQNLMTLLNGKKDLIDLSNLTTTRVLYTVVPEAKAGNQTKIILKDYDGSGVSK